MGKGEAFYKSILKNNALCVLATASKSGKPEAATIDFAIDENYNVYFATRVSYRKYKNLKENPVASIVVTEAPKTVQIDGTVTELKDEDAASVAEMLVQRIGENHFVLKSSEWRFFKLTPVEIWGGTYPKSILRFEDPREDI